MIQEVAEVVELKEDALIIARKYAGSKGYSVDAYNADARRTRVAWEITFRSNAAKPAPGDFFTVEISRKTGRVTRLIPGK